MSDESNYDDNFSYHENDSSSGEYSEEVNNPLVTLLFGISLLIGAVVFIFLNEKDSVDQKQALSQMRDEVIILPDTTYQHEYNNKAVFVVGKVISKESLKDPFFNFSTKAIVLRRHVEMFQWKEVSVDDTDGNGKTYTTYKYEKTWSSKHLDSSLFHNSYEYKNPLMNVKSEEFLNKAYLGDFYLSTRITKYFDINKEIQDLSFIPKEINGFENRGSLLYKGLDPLNPEIGDVKIKFFIAQEGDYSIAGKLRGKNIVSYTAKNLKSLLFIREGIVDAEEIFATEFNKNTTETWIYRGIGVLMMFIAFLILFNPIVLLASFIPVLGSIIEGGVILLSLTLTLLFGTLTIAIAWFAVRPTISIILISIGIATFFIIPKLKKNI
jgi:hypothetical protein